MQRSPRTLQEEYAKVSVGSEHAVESEDSQEEHAVESEDSQEEHAENSEDSDKDESEES